MSTSSTPSKIIDRPEITATLHFRAGPQLPFMQPGPSTKHAIAGPTAGTLSRGCHRRHHGRYQRGALRHSVIGDQDGVVDQARPDRADGDLVGDTRPRGRAPRWLLGRDQGGASGDVPTHRQDDDARLHDSVARFSASARRSASSHATAGSGPVTHLGVVPSTTGRSSRDRAHSRRRDLGLTVAPSGGRIPLWLTATVGGVERRNTRGPRWRDDRLRLSQRRSHRARGFALVKCSTGTPGT